MNKICLSKKSKFYSFEKEKRNYPVFFYFIERERERKKIFSNKHQSISNDNKCRSLRAQMIFTYSVNDVLEAIYKKKESKKGEKDKHNLLFVELKRQP